MLKKNIIQKLILLLNSELKNCPQFTYDLKRVYVFDVSSLLSSKILFFYDGKLLDLRAKLKKPVQFSLNWDKESSAGGHVGTVMI